MGGEHKENSFIRVWLMGVIGSVAASLSSYVGSILVSVSSVIASAVAAVTTVLATIITTVTSTIGSITSGITSAFSGEVLHTTVIVDGMVIPIEVVDATIFAKLSAWINVVKANFSAFLTAIHFETIIRVNEIGYITSSSYRNMMAKVYKKFGEFSEAIGRETGFIETAIQVARKTSLEVSSFLGKSYDLSEVVWLKDFNNLLSRIKKTAGIYANNPSQIWEDIDELIIKPAIDAKAKAQITMFATVKNLTGMLKKADTMLTTVQANFGAVVNELPAKWRQDLIPIVENVEDDIRHWRDKIFAPTIETLDKVIDVVYARTSETRQNMQEIAARLAKGGDILAEIDKLPDIERVEQEYLIAGLSSRITRKRGSIFEAVVDENYQTLESILAAVKFDTPPELWFVPEKSALATPIGKQAANRKTWFVGDY